MAQKTPFYQQHQQAGAKLVDFAGWQMPLHYGSQIAEHHYVRNDAGMFDVSHMTIVDIKGEQAKAYLQYLLANNVAKLKMAGKALYSCMLNEHGGVVDDLIAYYFADDHYRLVVNSATREKDLVWLQQHAQNFTVALQEQQALAILAVQGPQAITKLKAIFSPIEQAQIDALKPFTSLTLGEVFIARTGYTGEEGVEIILPSKQASELWQQLLALDVKPCGLAARDTLRLEAGMNLYGNDMDEATSPLDSGLAWTVSFKDEARNFIGKSALLAQKKRGVNRRLVGLVLEDRGIMRRGYKVMNKGSEGEITSGIFSPTLQKSIAFARIPATIQHACFVEIRGKQIPAKIVTLPFVREGQPVYKAIARSLL
ncbi:MAG: glycine cleavage system aminomethyltransferase GcvT [Gammaproteobacteria bacterium]|nr:glycine cleavage system aminomethyltransferase GcvT [Gammaproteobacteria bacterium]